MLRVFEQVSLPGVKRVLVPTVQFVLLYFLKVLFGSESMNELPRVFFSDLALMELVGFNAKPRENGLTKRGADHAPTLSREYQQAQAGRAGTALQSDGATAGAVGTALRRTHRRASMAANCPPPRAIRGAASSNKPGR